MSEAVLETFDGAGRKDAFIRPFGSRFVAMTEGEAPGTSARIGVLSRIAYVLCVVLLIVVWLSETGNLPGGYNKPTHETPHLLMAILTTVISLMGGVLGLLLALVPRKGRPYWDRFVRRFPFGLLFVMSVISFGSTYSAYSWHKNGFAPLLDRDLSKRNIPSSPACMQVHEGRFSAKDVRFVRSGNVQTQVDLRTNEQKEYTVGWLDACTYKLVLSGETTPRMTVYITEVGPNRDYKCMVQWREGGLAELQVNADDADR